MVIFHSYVSLPEGNFSHTPVFVNFAGEKLGRDAKRFLPATTLVWRDPTNARPGQVVSGRAAHDLFWYPDKAS